MNASVHDQSQIELDFDYLISATKNYDIDLYFFFPRSMGVSSSSYSRDQFYQDLVNHTRFHSPKGDDPETEVLKELGAYLGSTETFESKEAKRTYLIQQIKLFGNRINARLKELAKSSDPQRILDEARRVRGEIQFFRQEYVAKAKVPSLAVHQEVRRALLNVDEYLLNRVASSFSALKQRLETNDAPGARELGQALLSFLAEDAEYRRKQGQQYVDQKASQTDLEYFYYRFGLLKKFVSDPLYIEKKRKRQDRVYRNWVAGCGAALAGVWAQVADLQAKKIVHAKDIGFNFFAVALMAILIYVFKDRIKDISKEYFSDKLRAYLPDFKSRLEYPVITSDLKNRTLQLGRYEEFVTYLKTTQTPAEVQFIRKLHGRRDLGEEATETVLHYHKSIELARDGELAGSLPGVRAVKDVLRLNFSTFLSHLDDPLKSLAIFDEDEGPVRVETPKVYHVNLVVKVGAEETSLSHYRLILDKKGIARLETVTSPGQFSYLEGTA
jgi:hypothetical protein